MKLHFILKGNDLYYLEMPEEPKRSSYGVGVFENQRWLKDFDQYESALQSAKEKAILVQNQRDIQRQIVEKYWKDDKFIIGKDKRIIYSLEGKVEIEELCRKGSCAVSGSCIDEAFCAAKKEAIITITQNETV